MAEHGASMVGFIYDDEAYADPELDAWLLEVGRLLREGRDKPAKPPAQPAAKAAKPRAAKPKTAKPRAARKAPAKPSADA